MTISKINGIAWASISKANGITAASLAKINGIAKPAGGLTLGNTSNGSWSSGTTITVSHTVAAGSNLLIVSVSVRGTSVQPTISVTYNGVAMTQVTSANQTLGSLRRIATFYLISPATGANNIVATFSETPTAGKVGAMDYGGAHGSAPIGTTNANSGTGTTTSATVATSTGNIAYAAWMADNTTNGTPGDSQTEIFDSSDAFSGTASGYLQSPAASQTMRWTITSSNWVSHGFAIVQA